MVCGLRLFHESVSCLAHMNGKVSARIDQQGSTNKQPTCVKVPWIERDSVDEHGFPLYIALNVILSRGGCAVPLRPPLGMLYK